MTETYLFNFDSPRPTATELYIRYYQVGANVGRVVFRNNGIDRDGRLSYLLIEPEVPGFAEAAIAGSPLDLVDLMQHDEDLAWAIHVTNSPIEPEQLSA